MTTRDSDHYKAGAEKALANANQLVSDSDLLASNRSYGRAMALLILAAEESVKAMTLQFRASLPVPIALQFDQVFYHHRVKQGVIAGGFVIEALMDDLVPLVGEFLTGLIARIPPEHSQDPLRVFEIVQEYTASIQLSSEFETRLVEKLKTLGPEETWWKDKAEAVKKRGFYVDFRKPNIWESPLDIQEEEYRDVRARTLRHLERLQNWVGKEQPEFGDPHKDVPHLLSSLGSLMLLAPGADSVMFGPKKSEPDGG